MHMHSIEDWRHEHVFLGTDHARNERRSWIVVAVCGAMMVAEIVGGLMWGSMALVADGLHMSTHAGALVIAAVAYAYARRHARDERFAFGTGKLGDLAAFASAIVLAMIALLIGYESIERLTHPVAIAFDEAIPLAALGLGVNLLSAFLLRDEHHRDAAAPAPHHGHGDGHHHHHHHSHADHNLRAAYVHVLADAAVSVLALIGLTAGRLLGWVWMDPLMGIVGALVIAMAFSNLIALFIIITTAATLNAHGITDIQTSSQAAEALRPIAGVFTFAVFAAGIIGTGMLAVPVLAGSAAYALGEAFGWSVGLARLPLDAKAFYGTVAVATLVGVFINFVDIDPIKALFWSAVINGVVAVPLMIVMMLMTMRPKVMGAYGRFG